MPSANANPNATANASTNSTKVTPASVGTIPKDQLPDPVNAAVDGQVKQITAQIATLTTQQKSAQQYVTDTQVQIDALNAQLLALNTSITPAAPTNAA